MEIDPPAYQSQLSTEALQAVDGDHKTEHQLWHKNSNISPQELKKTGALIDELCASLVIECVKAKGNGKGKGTYYYCISCDEWAANNSWTRALPHVKKCKVCSSSTVGSHIPFNICSNGLPDPSVWLAQWIQSWHGCTGGELHQKCRHWSDKGPCYLAT